MQLTDRDPGLSRFRFRFRARSILIPSPPRLLPLFPLQLSLSLPLALLGGGGGGGFIMQGINLDDPLVPNLPVVGLSPHVEDEFGVGGEIDGCLEGRNRNGIVSEEGLF